MTTMTKSELIARLAERNPRLSARDADEAVTTILDAMSAALAQGSRIEIRGFGSFALNFRPPRVGRNPKSGDRVHVPAKYVPHFKAGKELRERVLAMARRRRRTMSVTHRSRSLLAPERRALVRACASTRRTSHYCSAHQIQ